MPPPILQLVDPDAGINIDSCYNKRACVITTVAECRSVTDSVGSHSDLSVHTVQAGSTGGIMTRPHVMDVICVIDICQSGNLNHRKRALEEVRQACLQIGARLNHIQVTISQAGNLNAGLC